MQRFLALVAIAALLDALPAQQPVPDPKTGSTPLHPEKQRIVDEVIRKRDAMRAGRVERYNVRVRLRLHNGSKLIGLVKNGRFVEQEYGIDFVESDRQNPEAGVRLWYFDDSNSFVFLRWVDIESHKVLATLTDEEVRAIEIEVTARDEQRRRAAAEKTATDRAAAEKAAAEKGTPPGKEPAGPTTGTTPEPVPALLVEFPPEEWSEARADDLERRKVVLGVFPNAQEQRFLEVLAEWKKVRDEYAAKTAKKATPPPAGTPEPKGSATPAKN